MDKQIEEMAREMCKSNLTKLYAKCDDCFAKKYCGFWKCSEDLINAGYRKIPEGAVVLTEKEFFARDEQLHKKDREYIQALEECINNRNAKVRTETAEKFAERLKTECYDGGIDSKLVIVSFSRLDEIAKEIKENKK